MSPIKAACSAWAQCLARALGQVAATNTLQAWRDLFMLPKAVLRPAPRGGHRHRLQAAQFTQRRCARWLSGEREELWNEPLGVRRPRSSRGLDEEAALAGRQRHLLWPCLWRRILPGLCGAGLQPLSWTTPATWQSNSKPSTLEPRLPAVPELGVEDVVHAIRSFSRGSAAGPTGLRGDHLCEALGSAHGDEMAVHLADVVMLLVRGHALLEVAPHLAGATLHALPKGADDVRPIAVGETLRRLTAKCLCNDVRVPARDFLCPLQVGVATRHGTEAVVHTARQWVQRHAGIPDQVLLKIDFRSNAFNTVDRAALLRETRLRLPGLSLGPNGATGTTHDSCFMEILCPQKLGCNKAIRWAPSTRGWLLEWCLPCGQLQASQRGLVRLTAAARQVGLQVNPAKCELVACGGAAAAVDLALFPANMPFNQSGGFELLGAPIGDATLCEGDTHTQRVSKTFPLLEALANLGDAQTSLLLLRQCASYCRLVYATRATPSIGLAPALIAFDSAVRACLETACTGPLTAEAWLQATLSTSHGELGLRAVATHAAAGYAASVFATTSLCQEIDPAYQSGFAAAIQLVNSQLPAADHFPVPAPPSLRQQVLSKALDRVVVTQLAAPAAGKEAYRAHFQLLQQPGAGAWLHAVPSPALGLHVVTPLFRIMVRLRLRLPVADSDLACPLCDGTADRYGDHARVCPWGDRVKRHNHLRNLLAARAKTAGLQPEVEKANLLPPRPEHQGGAEDGCPHVGHQPASQRRPADVWVPNWNLHGPAAFDLAVTSGLRQGQLAHSIADGGRATLDYEQRKCQHLNTWQACATEGLQFLPLVVEGCAGGWGPTASKTWQLLAAALSSRSGEGASVELQRMLQSFSIALQRENARAVLRRIE